MIPNHKNRELESSGVAETGQFGISHKDVAHVMTILRDTLYSDKILAVLREYAANAWDAHRVVGKSDIPISITLPTTLEPTLSIRDYGPGLSNEDVFTVYTQYGASTKRNDDNAVGMLGIGSKSGFAYADSFTVTSWHGGKKRVYVAVLDKTEKGVINLLHEEDCGEETGVMVQLAVKTSDIDEFEIEARVLYQHFRPQPEINTELPNPARGRILFPEGFLHTDGQTDYEVKGWTAVMGCVPYRVNLSQIRGPGIEMADYMHKVSGVLYFDIGQVHINASREELKYSDETKTAIVQKLNDLVDAFALHMIRIIDAEGISPWEKKIKVQVFRRMHLPVPSSVKDYAQGSVPFEIEEGAGFHITKCGSNYRRGRKKVHTREAAHFFFIDVRTKLWLRDEGNRSLVGYDLSDHDYVVTKKDPHKSWDSLAPGVDKFLDDLELTGIPVARISTRPWTSPNAKRYQNNLKHKTKTFKLTDKLSMKPPWSENWEMVDREPSDDDVFVLIDGFQPINREFFGTYEKDKQVAEAFGRVVPPVYAYKTTGQHVVLAGDIPGIQYHQWSQQFTLSLATDELIKIVEQKHWVQEVTAAPSDKVRIGRLIRILGPTHPISLFLRRVLHEKKSFNLVSKSKVIAAKIVFDRLHDGFGLPEVGKRKLELTKRYPLLFLSQKGLDQLQGGGDAGAWIDYVRLVDSASEKENDHDSSIHTDSRIPDRRLGRPQPHRAARGAELRPTQGCAAE